MHGSPGRSIIGIRLMQEVNMRGDTFYPVSVGTFRGCCAVLLFGVVLACVAQERQSAATQTEQSAMAAQAAAPAAESKPETTQPAIQTRQQKATEAENLRKKQIADGSTKILSMALALKAEVDKTTKDTLSINVIRKADEIEKLAHTVKEKMKQSPGAS